MNIAKYLSIPDNKFGIICLLNILIVAFSNLAVAQEWDFEIPDSIIHKCSDTTMLYKNYMTIMPLWPDSAPDGFNRFHVEEEIVYRDDCSNGNKRNRAIINVGDPGMMVFPALNNNSFNPCVVIFPGGAFRRIVFDKEGVEVAKILTKSGIAVVVVKYRTLGDSVINRNYKSIMSDTRRAVSIIRNKAEEFSVDRDKIGVMGFSAGAGAISGLLSSYDSIPVYLDDVFDKTDAYPNFAAHIYGGRINSNNVSAHPPTFFSFAADDPNKRLKESTRNYYDILTSKGVESEMRIFPYGRHGYGYGCSGGAVKNWPNMYINWLIDIQMLDKSHYKTIVKSSEEFIYDKNISLIFISKNGNNSIQIQDSLGTLSEFIFPIDHKPIDSLIIGDTLLSIQKTSLIGYSSNDSSKLFTIDIPGAGNLMYAAAYSNQQIYLSDNKTGIIYSVDMNTKTVKRLSLQRKIYPTGLFIKGNNMLLFDDQINSIVKLDLKDLSLTTLKKFDKEYYNKAK